MTGEMEIQHQVVIDIEPAGVLRTSHVTNVQIRRRGVLVYDGPDFPDPYPISMRSRPSRRVVALLICGWLYILGMLYLWITP